MHMYLHLSKIQFEVVWLSGGKICHHKNTIVVLHMYGKEPNSIARDKFIKFFLFCMYIVVVEDDFLVLTNVTLTTILIKN